MTCHLPLTGSRGRSSSVHLTTSSLYSNDCLQRCRNASSSKKHKCRQELFRATSFEKCISLRIPWGDPLFRYQVGPFHGVKNIPVGQPDGGRDAILYSHFEKATKNFNVFQVKFVRRPQAEADPHKWLRDIIKEEIPKVKRLIKQGADAYYLLTNVGGTAHPDSGSIDQVNVLLSNALKIPAYCWWRDDLNRRLDNASDLKWAYPEVMLCFDS